MSSNCLIVFLLSLQVSVFSYCHQEYFKCSSLKCINKRLQCDGKTDCEDGSDELNCDFKTTAVNNTNSTQAPNRTISSGLLTRGQSNGTVTHPYRRMKFRLTKKRIYNDNRTKRKKHPLREKNAVPPKSDATTTTTTYTTSMVKEMGASKRANIPCTREECEKRKNCFNEKWSHECFCDDATCSNKPGVMDARKDKDARMKGVFEWIVISIASAGLFLAVTFMILKRRRIRHNNVRPLHVRTVVCYHHGQATPQVDGTCIGRHMIKRGYEEDSMESRPLRGKKAVSQGIMSEKEANTCYIAMSRLVAHNK